MTENIISTIRNKFIENFDEGLLLQHDLINFDLSDNERKFYSETCKDSHYKGYNREKILIPNRKNPFSYLTARYFTTKLSNKEDPKYESDFYYPIYKNEQYRNDVILYWTQRADILNSILKTAPELIDAETITDNDLVFINVGIRNWRWENPSNFSTKINDTFHIFNKAEKYSFVKKADCKAIKETFADLFILTNKYFVKLSLGSKGVIDRTEHIIQRDVKKLSIVENNKLEVYFHGHFDPETIVLDDYKSALQAQRHLTELRQLNTGNKHNDEKKRK